MKRGLLLSHPANSKLVPRPYRLVPVHINLSYLFAALDTIRANNRNVQAYPGTIFTAAQPHHTQRILIFGMWYGL